MIRIERENRAFDEVKIMNLWVLVTSIHLTTFAIAQLEPSRMRQVEKMRYNNLRQANQNFITAMTATSSPEVRQVLSEMSFDSVGLIVEMMGMLAHVHPDQQEWFIREAQKLVWQSVNRQSSKV